MAKVSKRRRKVGVDEAGRPVYRDEGWKVRYVDPLGVERTKVFPKGKKAEADTFAAEVETRKQAGTYIDPTAGRMTFKEYAETWREAQAHRDLTAETVETRLRRHVYPRLGNRPIGAIRKTEIQALVKERSQVLAPGTLASVLRWTKTVFRAAVEDRVIPYSPAEGVKLPTAAARAEEETKVELLELDLVERLADVIDGHLRAMVPLGIGAGLRSGEGLGVTLDKIDFLRKEITVDRQLVTVKGQAPRLDHPKGRNRTIPLPDLVLNELAAFVAAHPPAEVEVYDAVLRKTVRARLLFLDDKGRPMHRRVWSRYWTAAVAAAAGVETGTRFHVLRHTYASLLIRAGCSVTVVQKRLGHASPEETLRTYLHLWPDDDDRTRGAIDGAFQTRSDQDRTTGGLIGL